MKKYIFMAAALMMMGMGMSSCSNEDEITEVEQAPKKVQLTLTASFDMGGETRATWDEDGITPKFATGDQVGVYSDNSTSVEPLDVTVDGDGIATLTVSVTPGTTYHLVYPYRSGSTYNSATKQITGFANLWYAGFNKYPTTALHYAMINGTEASSIIFQPLCAILKSATKAANDADKIYIKSAKLNAPVITVDGTGSATVDASVDEPANPFMNYYLVSSSNNQKKYYAVAPGSVTLVKGQSGSSPTKTATVEAGKIYNVAP